MQLVLSFSILLVARRGIGNLGGAFHAPTWMWAGGAMGLIVVLTITFAQPRIGATATIGILIAGQLVMGAVIDRFGLFGVDQIAITWPRALGIGLLGAGAALSLVQCEPQGEGVDRPLGRLHHLGLDVPLHRDRRRDDPAAARRLDALHRRGRDHGGDRALARRLAADRRGASSARASLIGCLLPGANAVLFFAERDVPTGLASLLIASVPLWVVLLRLLRPRAAAGATLAGVGVGFVGVAVLLRPSGGATTGGRRCSACSRR